MQFYNEKINYENPFLSMRIFRSNRTDKHIGNWHYHKELELLAVVEGQLDLYVEKSAYKLKRGDVAVIGSSELHRDRTYGSELDYMVLQFDLQAYFDQSTRTYIRHFGETNRPLSRMNYIFQQHENARREVFQCVVEILQESQTKQVGYEIAVSMLIRRIILILLRYDDQKQLSYHNDPDLLRLQAVFEYVDEHMSERITVEDACRLANMSYYYFVKYFKKAVGMNFTDFVNLKRIKASERLLLTKDISISEAAATVGMPNMAHFYKFFNKYNQCSPHEFRKKMK